MSNVAALEAAWAERVGARYCIALCNGTATLHTALKALGVGPGTEVFVPPLTMSSTTIVVLQAGATPVYTDVDADTWLMLGSRGRVAIPVSLYGLHYDHALIEGTRIDDAAQTLRPHDPRAAFTSYSLQASKIVACSEGGILATNDEDLARFARSFSSLGYKLAPDQPRIDKDAIKDPEYIRHHNLGTVAWNYRMSEFAAKEALKQFRRADLLLDTRRECAALYADTVANVDWIRPQAAPYTHDWWTFAIAIEPIHRVRPLADAIVRHGGERPYAAWRLSHTEPALARGARCPVADRLQPRLLQLQTNDRKAAAINAAALKQAIAEMG